MEKRQNGSVFRSLLRILALFIKTILNALVLVARACIWVAGFIVMVFLWCWTLGKVDDMTSRKPK